MPSAPNELISSVLSLAYKRNSNNQASSTLSEQLLTTPKQLLLDEIEFEHIKNGPLFKINLAKNGFVKLRSQNKKSSKMAQGKNEDKLEEPRVVLWSPEKVALGWKKSFPAGAGMANLGNTCYLNSSLQALFHIPAMANWLLDEMGTHIERCESNSQNVAFCSICAMMRTLKMSLDRCNNIIKPTLIHTKLKCIGKTLMYGRQEDAHEFIKLLIDHMEKSYITFKRAHKLDYRSKETTPLNQIFGGYLRQQVICPLCRYVSTTFSHFQDLVLDIRSVTSVDEALSLYFRKETLDSDNAYKCENCHKKVPATKRHLIERAPYVLLLQLKRFTISGGKITKHVNIQKNIDLSRYINGLRQSKEDNSYLYRLVSMVIHIGGSQHGGHYTAIAQTSNGIMVEFDDSSVHSIPLQSALLRNPYILFYEMVRKPKDLPSAKQVIRQSSERALLCQKQNDSSSKSLPTSRSTSCMANGTLGRSDHSQELRKGLYNPKAPLPQKERDRVTFGLKAHSPNEKSTKDGRPKLSKVGCNNSTSSTTPTNSSSYSGNKSFSWPRNGLQINSSNNSRSLGPCSEDSESDEETLTNGLANGYSSTSSQNESHANNKHTSKSKFHVTSSTNQENLTFKSSNSSSSGGDNIRHPHAFLPRSLQVLSSNNKPVASVQPNSPSKPKVAKSSDSSLQNKSSSLKDSSSKNSNVSLYSKPSKNCSVHNCEKSPQMHSDNSNSALTNFSDSEARKNLHNCNKNADPSCQPKLESQKSFSQESTTDKSETDSVESKFSQDSNKSEKSSRSVKKSIFSLLSCVSSTSSPDLSPNEDDTTISSDKNFPKSSLSNGYAQNCEGTLHNKMHQHDGSDSEDTDSDNGSLSKRDRDNEEHDSTSPSKKCKPEVNGCEALSKIRYAYTDVRDPSPLNDHSENHDKRKKNGGLSLQVNGESSQTELPHSYNSSSEENFSMEEKKSRHKWKPNDRSDEKESKNSFPNGHGENGRLNSNVITMDWNRNIKDLSHKIHKNGNCSNGGTFSESNHTGRKPLVCNGNGSSSVLKTLTSAALLPFGAKVKKWNDEPSEFDSESIQKQEALKRTFDEIHDEEIDSGKVPKKRSKSQNSDFNFPNENLFQKHQDYSNSNNNNNNHSSNWRYPRGGGRRPPHNRHHPYNKNYRKFSRSNSWTSSSRPSYSYGSNCFQHGSPFQRGNRNGAIPWHNRNNKMNFKRHNSSFGFRENKH